ncbi:hypothetical protein [Clostridium drakei]|uniref:Phage portal protein n=1 Tax=Clostridium drakei TaxID=332101 RepID=A0A2U8DMU6_9CLOT|nr:hypothetical protein [Clostridium drakei]AWI04066.1 hypothetical protein B9W14_06005 [Clostridium drakei]
MEFWFKDERTDGNELNKNQIFQLPVNPPTFEVQVGANNETFETEGLGEINIIGEKKLATITFSSFFPAQNYNFCVCTPRDDPYDYVWILDTFMHWRKPIRFIVTGTNINSLYSIENFTYKENAMSRDIEFTLSLKEYKKLS